MENSCLNNFVIFEVFHLINVSKLTGWPDRMARQDAQTILQERERDTRIPIQNKQYKLQSFKTESNCILPFAYISSYNRTLQNMEIKLHKSQTEQFSIEQQIVIYKKTL